jgi:hypothetical protein
MGALGGLLGVPAGLLVAGLVCVTADGCSKGVLWGGAAVGVLVGSTAAGSGEWVSVPVVRSAPGAKRVSLALLPARKGGGVGVRVSF